MRPRPILNLAPALLAAAHLVSALNGDSQCSRGVCATAIVQTNGTTDYTISVNEAQIGWLGIGFGTAMISTDLVVMWPTSTGGLVVSQRRATRYSEPDVVDDPDRVATGLPQLTSLTSDSSSFSFSVPSSTETRQILVWAWSTVRPSGDTPTATLAQHDNTGMLRLNLANVIEEPPAGEAPDPGSGSSGGSQEQEIPYTYEQKLIVAHAVLLSIAFLVILPIGALLARLGRTWIPGKVWFGGHWILQWPTSSILIIIGFALGIDAVSRQGKEHWSSRHKIVGLTLVGMYVVQCLLGGWIHHFKPKKARHRPPQNYFHAIFGLSIITISFYQVYIGYDEEWLRLGRGEAPSSVHKAWLAWVIIIYLLYIVGLGFLPRQFEQERKAREEKMIPLSHDDHPRRQRSSRR